MEQLGEPLRLKRGEAAEMIRKAPPGTSFAMHVRCDLVDAASGQFVPFNVLTYVSLTRQAALEVVGRIGSNAGEADGKRIPLAIQTYEQVGTKTRRTRATYWIG
jgi:hypothetical protein